MKTHGRFSVAFTNLKRKIDMIPLTAYDREEILAEMMEMRQQFETLEGQIKMIGSGLGKDK